MTAASGRRLRILLITHRYPPHGLGGVETWTRTLAHALAAEGHTVAIAARDDRGDSPFPPFSVGS